MKLSQEEKDGLAEHFKNKDLYDPSKAPEQEVASFAPCTCGGGCSAGMCKGGEMGYAEGGAVDDIDLGAPLPYGTSDFSAPELSADTQTARVPLGAPPAMPAPVPALIGAIPQLPQAAARPPLPRPSLLDAPDDSGPVFPDAAGAPETASPVKSLKSDEYGALLRYLQPSRAQNIGRAAMSGLAGLADAIVTGVGRAPSSSFQKNLAEKDSSERKDLTDALRQKYDATFKGRELEQAGQRLKEETRHNFEGEKETRKARELTQQAQDLTMRQHGAQMGLEKGKLEAEENKTALEQAEKTGGLWNMAKTKVGLGVPGPNPTILARAQGLEPVAASGPYGPTVVRGGKTYQWSPVSRQYHPVK